MPEVDASTARKLGRRILIGALVLIFLYPVSYGVLRGVGVLRPAEIFRNGLDERSNWGQFHTVAVITGSPTLPPGPMDRFLRRLYAPVAEIELLARGLK